MRGAAAWLAAAGLSLALGACANIPVLKSVHMPASASAQDESFDFTHWDSYLSGGDSSQYSSLDQVNRTNVAKLGVAWTYPAGEGQPPHFNPIVVNGVMYLMAQGSTLVALDAATGKELWRHANPGRVGSRGMNYWQSKDGRTVASCSSTTGCCARSRPTPASPSPPSARAAAWTCGSASLATSARCARCRPTTPAASTRT